MTEPKKAKEEAPEKKQETGSTESVQKKAQEKVKASENTNEKVSKAKKPAYDGKRKFGVRPIKEFDKEAWSPKTEIGRKVKSGEIIDIDQILDNGDNILEAEIIDVLLPNLNSDLLLIGQSKGKFGGGQRRVFRQTQKKTMEGNKPSFSTFAVVGDSKGHVGIGYGKARETVPAREKALRKAKINVQKIRRGCGSWQCTCKEAHSIPFQVEGKCGSVIVRLIPAPKGTGLCVGGETAKILKLAGIEDVWSKTFGKTTTRFNAISACEQALKQLMEVKIQPKHTEELNISE